MSDDTEAPVLELVTDRVRTKRRGQAVRDVPVRLDPSAAQLLTELSRTREVPEHTILLTAFQLLLGRYAGVKDVSVGSAGPEGVGAYRTHWEDDPDFATLLHRTRETPRTERLRAELTLGSAPSGGFDVALAWDETPSDTGELGGTLAYDAELFDRATAERMAQHCTTLLTAALTDPAAPVSHLVHTTPEERALLAAWGTEGGEARAADVVAAFRAQAEATPTAVALRFADGTLTYGELQDRSDRLARALVERGVTPESVVGLAMQQSASLVVAMLAVLTAGAAYLPLDSGHPESRLAYMVQDSGACVVLADRDVDFAGGAPVVRIEDLTRCSPHTPLPAVHPEQRACVLYTSGSTGRPKGVENTHRGIVRLVCDAAYLGFGPSDVVAQAANVSFDAASLEIWGALVNGAVLVGVPKDEVLSPELLRRRIEADGVTAMFLTTALFHQCADTAPAMFASLRTLFFGGEPADARRVAAVRRATPGTVRLANAYGPTEGTTFASTYDPADPDPEAARVPIGRPIAETSLYVLDEYGRPAGVGVPGELHLAGAGLARGYAGRPDLTAERFVPSPFGVGERLYRTGDVARWREDGVLECLGRADTQVKIRGVRIEPEEIASVLTADPGVRAAVVAVRGTDDAKRLAAYVVTEDGLPARPRDLRAHVAARLPEAMVPAWYVTLPELPLTPNGKVDLRALPEPGDEHGVQAAARVAPSGPRQELIARVWQELLGVREVGAHDDFFALGGHSLLAAQAASRIEAGLGVRTRVRDVFEAPTVERLAARLAAARGTDGHPPLVPAGPGPYRLSYAQQRLWFLDRLVPGGALYNVPLALSIRGRLDVPALDEALRALVARHASLRTRLVAGEGGEPRQVVADHPETAWEVEDLSRLPAAEREQAARASASREARRAFDLERGPLLRARLVKLADDRFELLLTLHHAASDGWSVGVLLRDLGALYAAARGAEGAALPPLTVGYPDYAEWQRRLLDDGARERQLAYWTERLRGAPPVLDLPTDRPRPSTPRYAGEVLPLRLPAPLAARLADVSRAHGVTPFMTLLAAFQLLLGRYAGVKDVSVGSPVSGRTRPELEELIGFFVNTLVLRTRWEDEPTFAELLERVRDTTLGAHDHQDVPFEQIVEAVRPPRDPGRSPLFQVMLSQQNVPETTTALPGLSVGVRETPAGIAKFDLTVAWDEAPSAAGELRGHVEYDVDLFDRGTVERMMRHYVRLLQSALTDPAARVSALPMLDAHELGVATGEPVTASTPEAATLHAWVALAARRRPERIALSQDGRTVTYAELEARSDAVCRYLRARGVRPGDTVVVAMERCLAWPAALLGVLKAGAAYVPMDARAARGRFAHVAADARAVLVLGSRTSPVPPCGDLPFALVEDAYATDGETAVPAGNTGREPYDVHPAAPAYILYTSGTTGRPKGVPVSHANLVHTLGAVAERYALHGDDRVLQFASLTFDVAAEELFATLVRAGRVVLPPVGPVPGIDELVSLARRERLTVLNLPASYWHEWVSVLDRHPPAACPALRLVVVGSERVDAGSLAAWRAAAPARIRWLNAYGPTETTITATVYEPETSEDVSGTVPIGRPLPGVRAHVLDHTLSPVPPGVPGELYLAGPGVSHGYLGDPARTATRFLPDPWGGPGERMYATGDRVRRSADGVLDFLGREDDQVKLRGFRIELGEIEAALAAHPRVRDAAVLLREDTPGQPALVGYAAVTAPVATADLRAHLADRVPPYMVPSAIVTLDRLPRGERGKTDRRALPPPAGPASDAVRGTPANETERLVAAVWRDVLATDRVGADDNFFEIGGHSLLIVRVQHRLAEVLGRQVPVVDLFRHPTVRTLARHLAGGEEPGGPVGARGRRRAEARRRHQGARAARRRTDDIPEAGEAQ
ncbi:amino acid adenylation domain-containing protein [Streptomyces sp. NPDC001920]